MKNFFKALLILILLPITTAFIGEILAETTFKENLVGVLSDWTNRFMNSITQQDEEVTHVPNSEYSSVVTQQNTEITPNPSISHSTSPPLPTVHSPSPIPPTRTDVPNTPQVVNASGPVTAAIAAAQNVWPAFLKQHPNIQLTATEALVPASLVEVGNFAQSFTQPKTFFTLAGHIKVDYKAFPINRVGQVSIYAYQNDEQIFWDSYRIEW